MFVGSESIHSSCCPSNLIVSHTIENITVSVLGPKNSFLTYIFTKVLSIQIEPGNSGLKLDRAVREEFEYLQSAWIICITRLFHSLAAPALPSPQITEHYYSITAVIKLSYSKIWKFSWAGMCWLTVADHGIEMSSTHQWHKGKILALVKILHKKE